MGRAQVRPPTGSIPPSAQSPSPDRLEQGEHVFRRCLGLDVVDGVEDKSAAPAEHGDALGNLPPHLVRRAEGQRLLRVHAAAPEDKLVAVAILEACASIPAAEHWTGLMMSTPASMKSSRNARMEPQEW